MRFRDHVALITGASSGIGAALAKEFARQGADVVLVARREDRIRSLAEEIEKMGKRAVPLTCDVRSADEISQAVTQARAKLGKIDIVVANAGFGVVGNVETLKTQDFRRQFETNVFGVLNTFYAVSEDLRKTKGRFAIIGSVNGYVSLAGNAPYAMSKFAVRALADSLHQELAPSGLSVTHICPGFVESEIRQVDNQGIRHERAKDRVPQWLRFPADQAAKQIVHAIFKRKREKIITFHGKVAVFLQRHLPCLFASLRGHLRVTARKEAKA